MRWIFSLSLCAVAGLVRLASAVENNCVAELCYDTIVNLNGRTEPTPTKFNPKPRTNAERMALGMPPNPPSRRHRAGKISVYCGPIHARTHVVSRCCCSLATIVDTEDDINRCDSGQAGVGWPVAWLCFHCNGQQWHV